MNYYFIIYAVNLLSYVFFPNDLFHETKSYQTNKVKPNKDTERFDRID